MATATFDAYADEELWLLRSERESLRDEIADLKAQLAEADLPLKGKDATIARLQADNDQLRSEKNALEQKIAHQDRVIRELQSDSETLLEIEDYGHDLEKLVGRESSRYFRPGRGEEWADPWEVKADTYTVKVDGPTLACEAEMSGDGLARGVRFSGRLIGLSFDVESG